MRTEDGFAFERWQNSSCRETSEAHVKYVSNSRRTKQKQNDEKVTKDDEKEDDSKNMMPCMEFLDIIFIQLERFSL